jgi:hypothetical protein
MFPLLPFRPLAAGNGKKPPQVNLLKVRYYFVELSTNKLKKRHSKVKNEESFFVSEKIPRFVQDDL